MRPEVPGALSSSKASAKAGRGIHFYIPRQTEAGWGYGGCAPLPLRFAPNCSPFLGKKRHVTAAEQFRVISVPTGGILLEAGKSELLLSRRSGNRSPVSAHERALQGRAEERCSIGSIDDDSGLPAVPMSQGVRAAILDPHPSEALKQLSHNPIHLRNLLDCGLSLRA